MDLSGRIAIVTGGTGSLGGAVVKTLSDAGAKVAVPFRRDGDLERIRRGSGIDRAAHLTGAPLDLMEESAVADYFARVAEELGGLDILVNTAGAFAGGKPAHETPWSVWQEMLDANLKSAVLASRAAVSHMGHRGGGSIVNVSSRPATQEGRTLAAYAASKRALLQLTEAMAAELLEKNITVNAVLPSTIDTPANRKAMPTADHARWVKPEEIARVILFLVGRDARIVSGAHVPVYGRA